MRNGDRIDSRLILGGAAAIVELFYIFVCVIVVGFKSDNNIENIWLEVFKMLEIYDS